MIGDYETGKRANVLCAEDIPANRLVLESILSDLNVNLVMAESGVAALKDKATRVRRHPDGR